MRTSYVFLSCGNSMQISGGFWWPIHEEHHPFNEATWRAWVYWSCALHLGIWWHCAIPIGSMYGIYANIGGILMGSMLPYIPYMEHMGYAASRCRLSKHDSWRFSAQTRNPLISRSQRSHQTPFRAGILTFPYISYLKMCKSTTCTP